MEKKANGMKIAALVVGLVGGIFCLIGGMCLTACAEALALIPGEFDYSIFGYLLGIGGAIVGIVGAALALKNGKIAGILMLIGFAMSVGLIIIFIVAYEAFSSMNLVSAIILLVAAILALIGESKARKA